MKLSELLMEGEYSSKCPPYTVEITEIVSDTSKITEGCLFICIKGSKYNPHKMLSFIEKRGASAVIVEEGEVFDDGLSIPIYRVKSSREALAYAYARFYKNPQKRLSIIGITGTNGKTSTSYILRSILKEAGYKVGLIGTVECLIGEKTFSLPDNSQSDRLKTMTTPDPEILYKILDKMASESVDYVIMEVSSHALVQKKVAPIRFCLSLFTNLSPEHLDFHRDMKSYMEAKSELFSLSECGIFNCDSEYADEMIRNKCCEILRCGVWENEDYSAKNVTLNGSRGIEYDFIYPSGQMKIECKIPAVFTVYNSLLAITAALKLGVSPDIAKRAVKAMSSVSGRLEAIEFGDENADFSVFIDFAHTEAALRNVLTTVRGFRRDNERIVLLFGCGGDRDRSKRAPMGRVAEELADFVIVTSDNSRNENKRQIVRDILSGMQDVNRRRVIMDRKKAIEYAIENAQKNDIIILTGKGHELYQIENDEEYYFDERQIAVEAFKKRKEKI